MRNLLYMQGKDADDDQGQNVFTLKVLSGLYER
jgi:hypothetical protein